MEASPSFDAASSVVGQDPVVQGRPHLGRGAKLPPARNRKIVVEKWCYFVDLYKIRKVLEDGRENG